LGDSTERHVEPHQLVSIGQRWYLLAYDRDREDWRTFRLDRIAEPWRTRMRFQPRPIPGGSAADYVEQSLRSMPMRYQVAATIHAPAEDVSARIRHGEGRVEPIDDRTCVLHLQSDVLEWIVFTLIWLGADFEVTEPAELVEFLATLNDRLAHSVAGG
jgi:predicted DNA-binding transcriptional regulator YafY